jgi:ADP-heptose:LPS heptosyltransferase
VKILIVRFSSIGDVVLTTPVIRCIKQKYPDAELHYLTKKNMKDLLVSNPYINHIHTIDRSINEVVSVLKKEKFDYFIDLHHNIRTLRLRLSLGVKTFAFPKLNWQKWLLVRFKINQLPQVHVVERYFDAVKPLGVFPDHQPGELFIMPSNEVNTLTDFGLKSGTFITIAIGAQYATKQLPIDQLTRVIQETNHPIVLVGGPMDKAKGEQLVHACANKLIMNSCGNYTLLQSASIVKQSMVLLTNDTGMMHIAACFGIRIVTVWGNTVPSLGMYPYTPNTNNQWTKHQVNNLACRPCSKIGYASCPKGHFNCMNQQDIPAIIADVNRN